MLKGITSRLARRVRAYLVNDLEKHSVNTQLLLGRAACSAARRLESIASLEEVELRVFSQQGKDGIYSERWLARMGATEASNDKAPLR